MGVRMGATSAALATALAAVLLVGSPAAAGPGPEGDRSRWTEAQIIANAEAKAPDVDETEPVPWQEVSGTADEVEPMPLVTTDVDAEWPDPDTEVGSTEPGTPVAVGDADEGFVVTAEPVGDPAGDPADETTGEPADETADEPAGETAGEPADETAGDVADEAADESPAGGAPAGQLRAQILGRDAALRLGVDGVLLSVTNPTGDVDAVDVEVEFEALADSLGQEWASRAQLVSLPDCALTAPGRPECRVQTTLASATSGGGARLSATAEASSLGVMAVTAGASGSTGDWSATPLSPSASWQVSAQTGAFTWSYPMRVPPAVGGPEPPLALGYSAASLDGKVVTTNNQTSWVGEGWSLEAGFVERKYVTCADDMSGGNNASRRTYDLCWRSDNATLVLDGRALELVRDASSGRWRVKDDDGTRVERLTGASNGDNDGEYWKVTTTDGTQYFFGRGTRPADGVVLNSTWTVPVFGNHAGEPCYASSFASSSCKQAWRWNLEYVVDPSGNSLTYVYAKETNYYGRNLGTAVSGYDRGGYLTRIEYGQRSGSENTSNAAARVVFGVSERCIPTSSLDCSASALTSATAKSWPDVPFDLICTSSSSCPSQVAPSFFTRKRLTTVTTQVRSGSSYQNVDRWTLTHTFPDPGDGTGASLWLDRITHAGLAGSSAITMPAVRFSGTQMPNRVDKIGDYGPPMNRYRITGITSETGATLSVSYTPVDCAPGNTPAAADSNTRRCMPVVWDPEGGIGPITEYFHKYLVDSVVADPISGVAMETHYEYQGSPAWRYDDSPLTPDAYRTWGDFRGYATVDVIIGAEGTPNRLRTRHRYFRGMHGDKIAAGGTRSVAVDGITDEDRLYGFQREELTYNGSTLVEATLLWPWLSAPTATGSDGTQARFLDVARTETRTPLAAGGTRTTRTVTTYESTYGTVTQVDDQGDVSTTADDRCTRTEYARNADKNIVATVSRVETVGVACSVTPSRPGDVISDERTGYDGLAVGKAPTRGLPTTSQRVASYSGSTPVLVTESTTTYDAHGRPLTVTDALGRTTTTSYTPTTGGPVTATTVKSPDPDGSGPLTAHVTTTEVNPAWGMPTKVTDPNGKVTTATYDALGRLTAVWLPGRAQGSRSANLTYEYLIRSTGVNAVTTKTLTAAEGYLTSVELYDGLLRPRQSQTPSQDRDTTGRSIVDTEYDSRGLVVATTNPWPASGAPATTLVQPKGVVPGRTETSYDGAGRPTAEIFLANGTEAWRTATTYGGDRVNVDPPEGAVPTTTITDARGRQVEVRQYTGAAPSGTYQATKYSYDDADRLVGVTDPAGNRWTYQYDLRGRQVSVTDPDRGTTTSVYDDAGQLVKVTDARGEVLAHVYDALGRQVALRDDSTTGALRASWTYDTLAKGQLTSATRVSGGGSYVTAVTGYDDGYRPLGRSVTLPSAEGALAGTYTTTYAYMPNGQLKSTKLPAAGGLAAETVTTSYDAVSMPRTMSGGSQGLYVMTADYDWNGQPLQYALGSNKVAYLSFDYDVPTRRLIGSAVNLEENITKAVWDLTYTYDAAGNPRSIVDTPTSGIGDAQCFAYDGLRRLTQAWTPRDGNCSTTPSTSRLGGAAPYWFTDTFDAVGNRTKRVVHAAAGNTTHTYAYPAAGSAGPHTLTSVTVTGPTGTTAKSSFTYDKSGNTTKRTVAGQPAQTLSWDAEGELTSVARASGGTDSFLYDADGERLIRRQGGATTVYLPGGMELNLAGGKVSATRYYTFNGQTVAVRTGTGASGVTSLMADVHGTAQIAVHNTTRAVTRRYTDPYGNPRGTAPSSWAGDHGFLGKPTDTSGLTAIGARYYDPVIGRFISVDPVMDLADPQQWHGYAYSNNNPVTWSDPTGLLPKDYSTNGRSTWYTPGYTPAVSNATRPGTNRQGQYTPGYQPAVRRTSTQQVCRAPAPAPGRIQPTTRISVSRSVRNDAFGIMSSILDGGADVATYYRYDLNRARKLDRALMPGTNVRMGTFRTTPVVRQTIEIGKNRSVRRLSKWGGRVFTPVSGVLDFEANYNETYAHVEDPAERTYRSTGRAVSSGAGGWAGGAGATAAAGLLCTTGAGCPFVLLAAGVGGGFLGGKAGEGYWDWSEEAAKTPNPIIQGPASILNPPEEWA